MPMLRSIRSRILRPAALTAFFLALLAAVPEARAGEVQLALGLGGEGSSWKGDVAGFGSLKLGYRWMDLFAIYGQGRLGYATVNERLLTMIQLGAQVWGRIGPLRPYARAGIVHQHEESWVDVEVEPAGAIFGVGDGIRHRAGGDFGLGLDLPIYKDRAIQIFGNGEVLMSWFPDPRGPTLYGGGLLGLGINYTL
jgi:hypothetical protein